MSSRCPPIKHQFANSSLKFQQLFATPQTTVEGIAVHQQSSNRIKKTPKQTVRIFPQIDIDVNEGGEIQGSAVANLGDCLIRAKIVFRDD